MVIDMDMHREIYYAQDADWIRLPNWCYSYLHVGAAIPCASPSDRRLVLALALPTRAYASALIATGLVIGRLNNEAGAQSEEEHIEMLRGLETGTPVIIHDDMTKTRGLFMGVKDNYYDGKTYVGVRVQEPTDKAGELIRWLPQRSAKKVAVLEASTAGTLRLPRGSKSVALVKNQAFVSHFLSLNAQRVIATKSHTDCIIVGQVNLFRQEALETVLGVRREGCRAGKDRFERTHGLVGVLTRFARGRLQDVVRVHRFCRNEEPFRSKIVPSTGTDPIGVEDREGLTVLFDGAAGFLRWRHHWPKAHSVLLLERTDPYFIDAVNLINQGFVNRVDEGESQYVAHLPAGAEATAYWESR